MAAQTCTKCGKALPPSSAFCTQCGTKVTVAPPVPQTPPPSPTPPTPQLAPPVQPVPTTQAAAGVRPRTCVNCKTQMSGLGQVSFRTGGWTGGAGLLSGSWNAAAENLQPFSLYYCAQCGKFDLYYAGT